MVNGRSAAWRTHGPSLVPVAVASAAIMGILVTMALAAGTSIEGAVSDQHEVTRQRFLGVVSTFGVLLWTAAATACVLGATVLVSDPEQGRKRLFFLASAGVTVMLLIDDLLLVHEFSDEIVARFVDFDRTRRQKDILEAMVFASYGAVYAVHLIAFRSIFRASAGRRFLVAAFALFAISVLIDFELAEMLSINIPDYRDSVDLKNLLEEGAKLTGIAYYGWFYFLEVVASLGPTSQMKHVPELSQ